MKRLVAAVLVIPFLFSVSFKGSAQEEARAAWQVTNFDITANIQPAGTRGVARSKRLGTGKTA